VSRVRERELRDPNFVRLWIGEMISEVGSAIRFAAVGFAAGTLGMVFAIGGISSFFAALKAQEVASAWA
jgi:hypothetical protein